MQLSRISALPVVLANEFKSDATEGIDLLTGERIALFNPRTQKWAEHF